MIITIDEFGTARFVYRDALAELLQAGAASVTRASQVEPNAASPIGWVAFIDGGPDLGPFMTRSEAIDAEIQWIETNRL